MTDKLGEATFVSGFNNWKNVFQQFEQHAQSSFHKEAEGMEGGRGVRVREC